jgi:putative protease
MIFLQMDKHTVQYPTMNENERNIGAVPAIPELLAPAGNFEKLATAIHYGADAVYLGGKELSLRAKAGNFDAGQMREAVAYAHARGVKAYVTINILAHNRDFAGLADSLMALQDLGADGLIVSDPGILQMVRSLIPAMPIHLSTQANVTNYAAAGFWAQQGASRLNLARELSLAEIREIRARVGCELEIFVHGALCISYSGRCMLSSYMTDRDANQGNCAHPCRYSYALIEEKRPGQYFPVDEDERGTYIFNSKDLCLLEVLPELVAAGVDSLKIEGRMKSIFYVGGVVRIYRAALDYLAALPPAAWKNPAEIKFPETFMEELVKTGTRGSTENFIRQRPGCREMLYTTSRALQPAEPVAVILQSGDPMLVEVRNVLEIGEEIGYMAPGVDVLPATILAMQNESGKPLTRANPGNRVFLTTVPVLSQAVERGILRRERPAEADGAVSPE